MAFNSILRKSNSFVRAFACAGQLIRKTQPGHRTVLFAAVNRYEDSRFHFSSVAVKNKPTSDEKLLRDIESEIKYAEDLIAVLVEEVPGNFPFKIVDSPGQQTIALERTYQGDEIKVEVHMPDVVTGKQDGVKEDEWDYPSSNPFSACVSKKIPFSVCVTKNGGTSLKFRCTAYPEEIFDENFITSLSLDQSTYEGPDFLDLGESLQKTLHGYLKIRGIEHSMISKVKEEVPDNFPFKIADSPEGEEIKVEVHTSDLVTGEFKGGEFKGEAHDDDKDDWRSERPSQSGIPLLVSVSKKVGPSLEITCVGYPDGIFIDRLSVKNPNVADDQIPVDLDESSQKSCHAYLESIGVNPATTSFLHDYMTNKDSREYLLWLKALKNFIQG